MKSSSRRSSVPSHRRHRERRLLLEQLEMRTLLATFYVDNTPTLLGPGQDLFTPNGGTQVAQGGLTFGVDLFSNVQAAINAAANSDTINVADGTYSELVNVNKDVTLQGNHFGADARTRSGASETIMNGAINGANRTTSFYITAANSTVDGFTSRDQTDPNLFNAGIVIGPAGVTVRNNIVTNNVIGIFATTTGPSLIERNLIDGNNNPGPAGGAGIYAESTNGLTIDDNEFRNHTVNNPIVLAALGAGSHINLTVSDNSIHDNVSGIFALGITGGLFQGNSISTAGTATALTLGGANTGIDVLRNELTDNLRGLRIADYGFFGVTPNSDIEAHFNDFSANTEYGVGISDEASGLTDGYLGTVLDVTANWWGDVTGPTSVANPGGVGTVLRNDFADNIDFQPWLVYSPDATAATAGIQLVTAFDVPAQTAGFTTTNNNYRRLVNVVETIQPGQTASLSGVFDWTETNAAASWALGNDDLATPADDFSLVVPANVNNATITSAGLGTATIQGPGDLAAANLEGVFLFDGGDNQGWTISNLQILDFDLAIGMFNGAGGSDAFNGTTIINNFIRIPADLNVTAAPVDSNQNIGIHFSFGANQTISNNTLEVVGSGASNGANFSSTVGMQSNTSGGAVYDGLLIDNNTINVTGTLAAEPSTVLGIWENGHAHTSDITVSNNDFFNLTGANSATNLMRAFRVTSHSGAATTVTYSGNTVDGASIGFQWLAGQNFAGNQPVRLWNNTITSTHTGVLIQSNGSANLLQNTITGSGAGGAVHVVTGQLAASGVVTSAVQENVITGGSGDGILIDATAGTSGSIFNNNLSGNAGLGVNNLAGAVADASGNWWGSNTPTGVAAEVSANVDYTPWLDVGGDTSGNAGFQGNFNTLHVDDTSPQAGATGRISEALDLLLGGGTVVIHAGAYTENVDATTQGVTFKLGSGPASVEINGDLTLDSDDFVELQLSNNPGTSGDLLDVSGAVSLGNATATLSALEPIAANNTIVVLKRGTGSDFFGNVANFQQLTVNGNLLTARYDLADGNDFGFVTQQNPSIGNATGTLAYTEQDPPTLIIPAALLTDADNPVMNGGYLQVLVSENAEASDRLAIRSVGSGPGEIQVVGNQVQYEGNTFGTVSGGGTVSPLKVTFTSDGFATIAAVQALIRSITFENISDAPATAKKVLFFVDDGSGGAGAINKSIAITLVNDAPTFTSSPVTSATEDAAYSYAITTQDVDAGATLTITASTLPAWLTLVDNGDGTATLSGTPTNAEVGNHNVVLEVSDGIAPAVQQSFTITVSNVNDAPTFTSSPVTSATEDAAYSYAITTQDVDAGATLTITASTLPAWLTLVDNGNGTATLSGTPTNAEVGTHSVVLEVSDGIAPAVQQSFTITVSNVNDAPTFTSSPVTSATEDAAYSYAITTQDVDAGATLTITASTLPAWLTLVDNGDGTATLSGTPTNAEVGNHNVVLEVSDGIAPAVQQSFTITVSNVNDAPTFTSSPVTSATEDAAYSYAITTQDVDAGATLAITASTLPAWLTLVDNGDGTATLSGTPTNAEVGNHNVVLEVSDGIAPAVQQSFTITVSNVNDAPTFTSSPVTSATEDAAYSYAITTQDVDAGATLTITASTLPAWLTLVDNGDGTATLSGTPTNAEVGNHNVVLEVSDGIAPAVQQSFTITVSNVNDAPTFTSSPVTSATEDAAYSYAITTQDVDAGATLTITASTLPAWLTLVDNGDGTATLSGTPTNAEVGAHNVVLEVSDGIAPAVLQSFTISVSNVNDVPVLDTSLNPTLTTINEDATNPAGTLVSDLLAGAVTDPDAGALQGIAISAASSFHGDWEYSLDGGTNWISMGTPTATAALLLPDTAFVRFIPGANFNGEVRLWYHAWDQTEGSAGGTLSARHNPDTASVGNPWEGAALTVLPINDVPVLDTSLNPTLSPTAEDAQSPASTLVADLIAGAVTDVDDGALRGIAVSAASSFSGDWEYSLDSGATWASMGTPTALAALLLPDSARVRFQPHGDFNGTVTLWYHAWDQTEGSAGGTLSARHNPDTASVGNEWEGAELTVLPVNDAPVLTLSGTIGYVHDTAPIQLASNATVSDIDSSDFDTGRLRVHITDGADGSNRLGIGAGFTVDDDDNVLQGSTVIGQRESNGFGTNDLVIRFNANATPFRVQQLVRAVTFKTVGGSAGDRKVVFDIKDGDGGLSDEAFKTVNVS